MTNELRDELARASWEAANGKISGVPWESGIVKANTFRGGREYRRVDAVLAEIEAQGFTVIPTKRYRALQGVATMAKSFLGFQSPQRATLLADAIKDLEETYE